MIEQWLPVKDYEGCYEVSNLGRVKSLHLVGGATRILKGAKKRWGYIEVSLYKNGVGKNRSVHRLVAVAFIPNPENKLEVNHINGDKVDNRVENLEWNTRTENQLHSYRVLGHKPWNAGKWQTHCKEGHELTPDNMVTNRKYPNGRACKKCHYKRMKVYLKGYRELKKEESRNFRYSLLKNMLLTCWATVDTN
jgi:hypothetical protein